MARTVTVEARRLDRWVAGFAERHRGYTLAATSSGFSLAGGDGARADVDLPYGPWSGSDLPEALAHLGAARRILVLIVRRGGYACAVVETGPPGGGPGRVVVSKLGSRHVQGRTAAGGWSQQRYARRRQKQTAELVEAVVVRARDLLLPAAARDGAGGAVWLATGGDRALVAAVLADARLRPLAHLPRAAHLVVGDPDRRLVEALPARMTAVTIRIAGPTPSEEVRDGR